MGDKAGTSREQVPLNGRMARQMVRTDALMGVDFRPRRDPIAVPVVHSGDKQAQLDAIRERHDRECPHCTVVTTHTQTVFGEGHPNAELVFVGEAPGAEEDRTGRPFVGKAGKLLERMIEAMGLSRSEIYIANVLKSRPPNNATPTPSEVMKCAPYLVEQLTVIAPKAIVTLGAPSTKFLLDTTEGISKLRGRWHECRLGDLAIPVMPTFHPAYLLRSYTPENRAKVWSDLQAVMKRLAD